MMQNGSNISRVALFQHDERLVTLRHDAAIYQRLGIAGSTAREVASVHVTNLNQAVAKRRPNNQGSRYIS